MQTYTNRLRLGLWDEEGTSTVEYALLLAAVVVVTIGAWTALGSSLRHVISSTANSIGNGF
jgi:Flp pilus assembly pilin Flp